MKNKFNVGDLLYRKQFNELSYIVSICQVKGFKGILKFTVRYIRLEYIEYGQRYSDQTEADIRYGTTIHYPIITGE
jgi:hypothetical protein